MTNQETQHPTLAPETLTGTINTVTFHNPDNGYSVLKIHVHNKKQPITVIGLAVGVAAGVSITCRGHWTHDTCFGQQFAADQISLTPPHTTEGIRKYLNSGMIKGIGPHYAQILIDAFKEKLFDVIEHEPEKLLKLPGIGMSRKKQLIQSWNEQKVIRDIMIFLHSYGFGTARAISIYKAYGHESMSKMREDPYCLSRDIRGFGFKITDDFAQQLGIAHDAPIRANAGVCHVLDGHTQKGHCAAYYGDFCQSAVILLGINKEIIQDAIDEQIQSDQIVQDTIDGQPVLFMGNIYHAENQVAKHVHRLLKGKLPWQFVKPEQAIPWVEQQTGLHLAQSQKDAIQTVIQSKVSIITGGPGVGKTTIVQSIINILKQCKMHCVLCAPTGRAAKRLAESSGLPAKTIHRLLIFDPVSATFKHHSHAPLVGDFFVVDEASMVDIVLMHQLIQAIPDHAAVLLVGDTDQLPSVGPGNVLSDLIESQVIPVTRLTEIFRQAHTSRIIVNAHRVNEGHMPIGSTNKNYTSDFYLIEANNTESIHNKLIQVVNQRIPERFGFNPIHDIQVLTPMNNGPLGTKTLNPALQKVLNPDSPLSITRFNQTFCIHDKVIQLVNNYDKDVFNGDIGFVHYINTTDEIVHVFFDDRMVEYPFNALDELALAYATTIHKSQGSEYPVVVIPLATQHYNLLQRNLLYTGITRGKKLVVLIGQAKAFSMAVRNKTAKDRITKLKQRLEEYAR